MSGGHAADFPCSIYLLLAIEESLMSPEGLAPVTSLARVRVVEAVMGAWFIHRAVQLPG